MSSEEQQPAPIDFNNIKNIDAVLKEDPSFASIKKKSHGASTKKKSKFEFDLEPELISLPSKGLLYTGITEDEDILAGKIQIFPMTGKDEEILTTQRFIRQGTSTRMILENCIASNISAKDLLLLDSNFLLFYLRQISYGDQYKFTLTCQNSACQKKFEHEIYISQLQFNDVDDSITEPVSITLPRSQYTVNMLYPRIYHSEMVTQKDLNRKKSTDESDTRRIDLWIATTASITSKSGKDVLARDWEDFYTAIPAMDVAEIRERMELDSGLDELKGVFCPYCNTAFNGFVPMGLEFFRL